MKKYNIFLGLIFIGISAYMILTAQSYNQDVEGTAMGAGVWPTILAVAMIILSLVLIVQSLFLPSQKGEAPLIDYKSPGMKRVYLLFGVLAAFVVLLKLFGFYVAVLGLVPAVMAMLGERRPKYLVGLTVGILVFIYLVFVLALKIKLPKGLILKI